MVAQFAARPALLLLVPPEGTRSRQVEWKSGFYHIAHQARVPIILTIMDYGTHTIRVAGPVEASGDYERDLPVGSTCGDITPNGTRLAFTLSPQFW